MTGTQIHFDDDPDHSLFAEDLAELSLSTFPAGTGDGAFHTKNDPTNPFQRDNIVERHGKVDVRCEHKDIVHGYFSDDIDDPYSLIVLEFQFSPNGLARRIREARITIRFAAMERDSADPIVTNMYPQGSIVVQPKKHKETLVKEGSLNIGGGVAGVELGGELKAGQTVEREVEDATTLRGSIDLVGRNWGPKNAVSWTLLENQSTKTGVIRKMQSAVLLKRRDMSHFKASVTIKITADTVTNISSIFTRDPEDEDVWYNPDRTPSSTDRLQTYDTNNLGAINLKSVSEITFLTVLKDATKEL